MVLVKHSDNFTLPLFHSKYCSHVTNYKHDDRVKIWGYIWQNKINWICASENYAQKWTA